MPAGWKIFRVICVLQLLGAGILLVNSLVSIVFDFSFGYFAGVLAFLLVLLLAILALNILNSNYPDIPIAGQQKKNFNRLFLLNFLFLVFLFGFIFSRFQFLQSTAKLVSRPVFSLPFSLFWPLVIDIIILAFQLVILYGLYQLRRELYFNFVKKEFEFEKQTA